MNKTKQIKNIKDEISLLESNIHNEYIDSELVPDIICQINTLKDRLESLYNSSIKDRFNDIEANEINNLTPILPISNT